MSKLINFIVWGGDKNILNLMSMDKGKNRRKKRENARKSTVALHM